ncbi:hypothetical protein [Pseudomonas sp. RIT-PI-AD]|uniref:hypothetical protein n=1 Tax=Pseudomonas sp. RIT-PI-AD TaxID=3035294 RepID=UPI0021D9F79D|nr:hypothetical protein [Pseudomonas sp. RIT-PI-AD]
MRIIRTIVLLALVSQLAACAFGRRIDYTTAVPNLNLATRDTVAVSVIEERPYVLSRSKHPNYVGTMRGGYYNPFNVVTLSGGSLATDLQQALVSGLQRSGIKANTQIYKATKSENPGEVLLVIQVREWKSDTYVHTRFDYDLTATVYDHQGKTLATQQTKWSGQIANFIEAGKLALAQAVDNGDIKRALEAKAPETVVPAKTAPAGGNGLSGSNAYDECMKHVMRVTDRALRLQMMFACDTSQ